MYFYQKFWMQVHCLPPLENQDLLPSPKSHIVSIFYLDSIMNLF